MDVIVPVIIFLGIILSIVFVIVFLIIKLDPQNKSCTQEVEAEITGFTTNDYPDLEHPNLTDYSGKFKYTYNGVEYEGEGSGIIPDMYKVGQKIKIYINPNNPAESSTNKQFAIMVNRNIIILLIVFLVPIIILTVNILLNN